jgi:hypothetical protein
MKREPKTYLEAMAELHQALSLAGETIAKEMGKAIDGVVKALGIQADPVVINKRTLTPSWWPKAERVLIIGYLTQLALVTYFWLALKGR